MKKKKQSFKRKKNKALKKKKKQLEECNDQLFTKLPLELVLDIFARLPLKTISQCRWVSKKWYDFILHPRFPPIHFAKQNTITNPWAIFHGAGSLPWAFHFLIDHQCFDSLETSFTAYEFLESTKSIMRGYVIVGCSVNGLICLRPSMFLPKSYCVCNPITGEHIFLPEYAGISRIPVVSGFGFDSINNEYKVLRILRNSSNDEYDVEVYTLGAERWRAARMNIPYIAMMKESVVLMNNHLYWLVYTSFASLVILSFNMATEDFHIIQLLPNIQNIRNQMYGERLAVGFEGLTVLGNHLCLFHEGFDKSGLELWVFKEAQVSWQMERVLVKEVVASHDVVELKNSWLLLLHSFGELGYYEIQEKIFHPIEIHNLKIEPFGFIDQTIFFTGSLFSPKNVGQH